MSKLFNSLRTPETSPRTPDMPLPAWRVKLSDGAVYGPIELGELRAWVEECRIAPGDQVSSDNVHWVNVEALPELAMQWMVEMASGEIFGPVHLHAVIDFVNSRLVMPNSLLSNRVTGEAATVADLVLPLIADAAKAELPLEAPVITGDVKLSAVEQGEQERAPDRLPSDQHKEKLQLRIEQLQATVDESESRIKQLRSDLDSQQAQMLKLRDDKAALEKTYLTKLGDVQKNYDVAVTALEKAEAQVQALRDEQARRGRELVDRISTFSVQTKDISGQIAEKNNVISRLEAELIKARGDFEVRIRDLQGQLGGTKNDLDSTLNNLREKESSLSAAVREREQALQSVQALTERYEARVREYEAQISEFTSQKQTFKRELEMRQKEINRLGAFNAALTEKEQQQANAARNWDSVRLEKESRIKTLTRQIEGLSVDLANLATMRSALEQNRAELEQARQETRDREQTMATREKELNEQHSDLNRQILNLSENLAAREKEVADQRERIEVMTNEAEQQSVNCQRLQGQLEQTEKEASASRDLFQYILMAELARQEAELSQEESAFQAVQSVFSSKKQSYLKQIDDIQKYIKGDLADCRESYLRQQKSLENVMELEAKLEHQNSLNIDAQTIAKQTEQQYLSQIDALRNANQDLTQRLEKDQEEYRELQRQSRAALTSAETLGKKREAEWNDRMLELEEQYRAAVERTGQTDSEFKRREMLWVTEKSKLDQEQTALQQRLAESEKVAETIRAELREQELNHQAALKESQDGLDEAMRKAQAADMECDKIRQDLDQLQSLFQERLSADKEREREIAELQNLNDNLEDIRRQEERRFQEELERQKREVETKVDLVNTKDKELGQLKQTLNSETETRQALTEKLAQMETAFAEAQETARQLKDKMAQDEAAVRDFQERTQLEHNELNLRLDAVLGERRELESRLAIAAEALEKQNLALEDAHKQTALREEEWQQQTEQSRLECETLNKHMEQSLNDLKQSQLECANLNNRLEQASNDLGQARQMHEESIEDARLKMEELQRTVVQLQQECQGASVRFEQQKKFYEEERELRRQKEQELHQQRKNYQEVMGTLRQKEQLIIQQKRQFDEELLRARQQEGAMARHAEQAQKNWRTSVVKPVVTAPATSLPVVDRRPLIANVPNRPVTSPELIGSPRQPPANLLAKADKSLSSIGVESGANGLPTREPPSDEGIRTADESESRPEMSVAGDSLPSVEPEGTGTDARPDKLIKKFSKRGTKLSSSGLKIHNIIS